MGRPNYRHLASKQLILMLVDYTTLGVRFPLVANGLMFYAFALPAYFYPSALISSIEEQVAHNAPLLLPHKRRPVLRTAFCDNVIG